MARPETQKEKTTAKPGACLKDNRDKTNLELVMETMPVDWKMMLLARLFYAVVIFVGTLWILRRMR